VLATDKQLLLLIRHQARLTYGKFYLKKVQKTNGIYSIPTVRYIIILLKYRMTNKVDNISIK